MLRDLEQSSARLRARSRRCWRRGRAGARSRLFDEDRDEWGQARAQLLELAGEHGYAAARRTTINAHYTHPAIAAVIWQTVARARVRRRPGARARLRGRHVHRPGAAGAEMTGVELDPTTAASRRRCIPTPDIRTESFADTRLPDGHFDLAVGNVPFADVRLHDPQHNPARHSIHNHFILKSLALTRPGGLVAVLTSRYTLDAANPAARREMSRLADLRRRDPAAERRAPPCRRHRRAHGPADPPPPRARRAGALTRAG